jgi:hypothetical protein
MFVSAYGAHGDEAPIYARHTREHFRHEMIKTVRADHPAIVPVANAIRAITSDPMEQLVIVNDVAHLLVDYDSDERVYGVEEFHATLNEMLAKRRENGWIYLRDDCDGQAVFAAHLLVSLGIPCRLEASYWKEHAWVIARVHGVEYDLLDLRKNAPEMNRFSYKLIGHFFVHASRRPPPFDWRHAWAVRTHRDFAVGEELGLLTIDSTPAVEHERYATDWTEIQPAGRTSPFDPHTLTARVAGFPFGESLHVEAIASAKPAAPPAPAPAKSLAAAALASPTNSRNSGN